MKSYKNKKNKETTKKTTKVKGKDKKNIKRGQNTITKNKSKYKKQKQLGKTTEEEKPNRKKTKKPKEEKTPTKKKTKNLTTQLLYLYDLKCKINDYNRIKRVFYYRFNKLGFGELTWKSKSALLVPDHMENLADKFFNGFKGCVEVYKVELISITRLY